MDTSQIIQMQSWQFRLGFISGMIEEYRTLREKALNENDFDSALRYLQTIMRLQEWKDDILLREPIKNGDT